MDAIYNVLGVKSSFYSVFSLNYVTISTNKKIRNEYPASTGSLADSKRVISTFNLSSTRTNLLHQSRHVEIDAAGLQPGFDKKSRKHVVSGKLARTCRKPGCKPGRKPGLQPGLQLARIMERGLYCATLF